MICLRQIKIPVMDDSIELLKKRVLQKLRVSREDILDFTIHKKSIDARDKKNVLYVYEIYVSLKNEDVVLKKNKDLIFVEDTPYVFPTSDVKMDSRPIIVGSGPSGLFCSYMLAEAGYNPIILERGDSMDDRVKCVEKFFNDTVLVMNSDLFTNINYEDFYLHFKEHDADMSVAAVPYNVSIPLGIFDLEGRIIKGLKEKPKFEYYANAGIYMIKKSALDYIPEDVMFHSTDLIEALIAAGRKVIRFPLNGTWIDIGTPQEFQRANELVNHMYF